MATKRIPRPVIRFSMAKRVASILFWIFVCYTPIGLGAALVAGVCMGVAKNHATTFAEEATGHVVPFIVGPRSSPRTIYVTQTFSEVSDISRYLFGAWFVGPITLVIAGAFLPKAARRVGWVVIPNYMLE